MKDYVVRYVYENSNGSFVANEEYCYTEEATNACVARLKERRDVTSLTVITYEKVI